MEGEDIMLKYRSSVKPVSIALLMLFFITSFILTTPKEAKAVDYTSSLQQFTPYTIFTSIPYHETLTFYVYINGSGSFRGGTLYGGKDSEINRGDSCSNTFPSGGRVLGTISNIGSYASSNKILIPPDIEKMYIKFNGTSDYGSNYVATINYKRKTGTEQLNIIEQLVINTQTAASNTQNTVDNIYNQINHSEYGLNALKTKIENLSTPVVTEVTTTNKTTASNNGRSPTIIVEASSATHFDLSLDGINWGGGYSLSTGGEIAINPSTNKIRVRAYDASIPLEQRRYGYGSIIIFGL